MTRRMPAHTATMAQNRHPSLTSRPLADHGASLARWIGQVDKDTSGFALPRLVEETEYSDVFWHMHRMGVTLRMRVGKALYAMAGRRICPNPFRPFAFSFQSQIAEAAYLAFGLEPDQRHLVVPPILPATRENGLYELSAHLAQRASHTKPIYAWIETYPDRPVPELCIIADRDQPRMGYLLDDHSRIDMPMWCWQAACALGAYQRDHALYTGLAQPGGAHILPPDPARDPSITPILHSYAKGLLGLGVACPPGWPCQCGVVLAIINMPPAKHAQATGVLEAWHDPREDGYPRHYENGRRSVPDLTARQDGGRKGGPNDGAGEDGHN